ncbi:uncharacterized protein LOC120846818 [Ixodes scapularis]|uniref:uncharacterized protein LOC120846818 n=1 Tax=Ixodes scapularis TaxID=6945 RepID=UPI001A9E4DF0|nr:uncharacterized protein LOC120846818 [Ixodes scapularis]
MNATLRLRTVSNIYFCTHFWRFTICWTDDNIINSIAFLLTDIVYRVTCASDDCHSLHLAVVGIAVKCQTMTCAPTDRIKFRIAFEDAHMEQVVSAKHNGNNNSSPRGLDNDFPE